VARWRLRFLYLTIRLLADGPLVWMFYFLHFSESGSGGFAAAAGNALLFLPFAILHSVLAREGIKKPISRVVSDPWVRPLYVIVSGLTLALVLYLWRPLDGTLWSAEGGAAYWLLTALFALVYSASQIDYPEFLAIRGLYREAKGTPPKPPRFVVKGPYAYCRHPMYWSTSLRGSSSESSTPSTTGRPSSVSVP
jgi:protein-S-isoprenylcysteine O-methyltransferase Ste14